MAVPPPPRALGSETKTLTRSEVGSPAGALLMSLINSPSVGDKLKLDTVNGICVPFVAENSTLPISIAGHNFYCLIDSGGCHGSQRKSVA